MHVQLCTDINPEGLVLMVWKVGLQNRETEIARVVSFGDVKVFICFQNFSFA